MKKLIKDDNGAGHILLIIVFVVALAGIVGFAYTRISDQNKQTADSSSVEGQDDESGTADDDESTDNGEESDPTEGMDEAAN